MDSQTPLLPIDNTLAAIKVVPTQTDLKLLLEHNVVVVDFTKLNGDRRVMTCTNRSDIKPPATKADPLSQKKIREINDAVIGAWDVNSQGWRSFRYDRVNSVTVVEEYQLEWFNKLADN